MKPALLWLPALVLCLLLPAGCGGTEPVDRRDRIPFEEGQYYAAAYLGCRQIGDLDYYREQYLGGAELPVHYLSDGDWYLVIPRWEGMALSLLRSDIETGRTTLLYQDPDCRPFLIQCNASDIFADAVIRLTYEGETVEFSPFLSLKDGSVDIGDRGLDLTRTDG